MQPVNIGNPAEITIRELVEALSDFFDRPLDVIRRPLPRDDPKRRRPDISRAGRLLGWQPRTSLRAGLEQTVSWFAEELKTNSADARMAAAARGPLVAVGQELNSETAVILDAPP